MKIIQAGLYFTRKLIIGRLNKICKGLLPLSESELKLDAYHQIIYLKLCV